MIKIVYIIDTIYSPHAGTENQLLQTIARLDKSKFEPRLVVLRNSDWLKENDIGCPVHCMNFGSLLSADFFRCRKQFVQLCREHRIDIVQTFFRDANYAGVLWARKAKVPVIIASRRNLGSGYWHSPMQIRFLRYLAESTSHYIANSQAAANETITVEKVPTNRVSVIHNGIDKSRFIAPSPDEISKIRQQWGLEDDHIVIGAVANLRPVKNIPFLVEAAKRQLKTTQDPNEIVRAWAGGNDHVRFVVLGEGDQRASLESQIKALGLTDRFILPGRSLNVPHDLYAFDIAVLCSHGESLSNSLMEYMITGRPTIASNVGGNGELISHRRTGFLFDSGNEAAFDGVFSNLLPNEILRTGIGSAAREHIIKNFSFEAIMGRLENLYSKLLENQK